MKAVPQLLMAHSPRHKKPNTESLSETRTGFFFGRVVIYLQRTAVQDPRVLLYLRSSRPSAPPPLAAHSPEILPPLFK